MPTIDIGILIVIGMFAMAGFRFGIIQTLGSLLGTVLGVYLATRYYEPMADFLVEFTGWGGNLPEVVMFIVAFIVINRLVGFAFWLIDKSFGIITRLPFLNSINKLAGFALGILEGIVTIGVIIYFVERFPLSDKLMEMIATSNIAPWVSDWADVFVPLFPDALSLLESSVDFVEGIIL